MRWLLALLISLAACPAQAQADPAVVHANRIARGVERYGEGWYGRGDTRLHYVTAGKGPLVILYHGFPSFWYSWFDQMEVLKTRYRVVAVDGLGAGLSAKPAAVERYRIANLAAQIDGLARHLNGRRRFVLIGHDWGAALAFAYAQAYPGRLHAVVGMSAPPFNLFLDLVARDPEQQRRSQYMRVFQSLPPATLASPQLAERIWRQSYDGLVAGGALTAAENDLFGAALRRPGAMHGGINWYLANIPPFDRIDTAARWPAQDRRITAPALLIWGTADTTFVPGFIDRMRDHARDLRIVRLDGVGHWTPMEGAASSPAIEAFLADHVATRRPAGRAADRRRSEY